MGTPTWNNQAEYPLDAQQESVVLWHEEVLALRDIWVTCRTNKRMSCAPKCTSIGHFDGAASGV